MPLEARAGAERHDRHAGVVRVREHRGHLCRRLGIDDHVRPVRHVVAQVGGVLVERGLTVVDAALVRDEPQQVRAKHGRSVCQAVRAAASAMRPSRIATRRGARAASPAS